MPRFDPSIVDIVNGPFGDYQSFLPDLPTSGFYWASGTFPTPSDQYSSIWKYVSGDNGINVDPDYPNEDTGLSLIWRNPTSFTFKRNRSYQILTKVGNFSTQSSYTALMTSGNPDDFELTEIFVSPRFSINTEWGDSIDFDRKDRYNISKNPTLMPPEPGNGYLLFYSSPDNDIKTSNYITYTANKNFGTFSKIPQIKKTEYIYESRLNELDFNIQGFAWWRDNNSATSSASLSLSASTDGLGWCYYNDTKSYIWFDDISGNIKPCISSVLGDKKIKQITTNTKINCLYKYIESSNFNLTFTYTKLIGGVNDGISLYLSQEMPENRNNVIGDRFIPKNAQLLASYTQSGSTFSAYFGLTGKQYLIITASQSQSSTVLALSNIEVSNGYWKGNNRRYLTTDTNVFSNPTVIRPLGVTGATFSTYTGSGNTYNATQSLDVQQLFSKIGNGRFMSGVWENGVWNSGWRSDDSSYEMYNISNYFSYEKNKIWKIEIKGPQSTVSKFRVGDKISIGNIVAIDFNQDRKLLKGRYTILSKTSNTITIEITNNFPLSRIEKDSNYHRILITKNVWLAGAFMNGYFKGVWNSGLFKGYPLSTEMYDSHWIDGIFDGGHFSNKYHAVTFSNTYFVRGRKFGMIFSTPHKLTVGDTILVSKSNKRINSVYDGETTVIDVPNEYQITTDINFAKGYSSSETGVIYTEISSGLIQNFTFKSNNTSTLSSVDYLDSDAVFLYNSWIDVNYYTHSAVNIGKPNTLRNVISKKEYSQNNLYGYPTNDILSSVSTFRNSFNNKSISLNLGNKYKIYEDYIGDSSQFQEYFTPTNIDPTEFINLGWQYSTPIGGTNAVIFTRSIESKASNIDREFLDPWVNVNEEFLVGGELQIDARGSGGVLDLTTPAEDVNFRRNDQIKKDRYTMIEFDLARWSAKSAYYVTNDSRYINLNPPDSTILNFNRSNPDISEPVLHFDNLNLSKVDIFYGNLIGTSSTTIESVYLPIYKNVNHLLTKPSKKIEYFYNKRNLSLNFRGSGFYGSSTASILIDNLKLYEVDMIPFFQYFNENTINFGVEVPYQAIAPFIDYKNANFQFLDHISIGIDSFSVNASNVAITGVGVGIGLGGSVTTSRSVISGVYDGREFEERPIYVTNGGSEYSPYRTTDDSSFG